MASARQHGEQQSTDWPCPRASDICVGAIIWLPEKITLSREIQCCCQSHILDPSELDPEGYNHPAVVLRISQNPGSRDHGDLVCDVACLTSFDGLPLTKYIRKRKKRHYKHTIPIFHSKSQSPADEHITQLHLESGDLHKQSYVRTSHIYPILRTSLRSFGRNGSTRAYKTRLTKEGYCLLMEKLGLASEEYVQTNMVPQESGRRLLLLANPQSLPREILPVPHVSSTIEPARQIRLVFPEYAPITAPTNHNTVTPNSYASIASSAVQQARRERLVQYSDYGVTMSTRYNTPAFTYTPPTPNIYQNYTNPQNVWPSRQSPDAYRQPTPDFGQTDNSGDDDWAGTVVATATIAFFGLIIWWKW